MRDEFPENGPGEETRLQCMPAKRLVRLHDIDLSEEDFSFDEVGKEWVPEDFLRNLTAMRW